MRGVVKEMAKGNGTGMENRSERRLNLLWREKRGMQEGGKEKGSRK